MGHTLASWKLLESMMLELKQKGVSIPTNILEDLKAAKSMIQLSCMDAEDSDALREAEELSANVEVFLVNEAQKIFGAEYVDGWLRRLEEAKVQECQEPQEKDKFVTGVPRDQKWVRVEPSGNLTVEHIEQIAKEENLTVNLQKDGRLVVYGQQGSIKRLLSRMVEVSKRNSS